MMSDEERKERIKKLLRESKAYPSKGRYYVYEMFKQDLIALEPTTEEYAQTMRQIAINLKV